MTDLDDPRWDAAGKVHDWRNHVTARLRELWPTFTPEQKAAIYEMAEECARREEWE